MSGKRLAGETAIITGGNKGIGRAIALAFAKEGANIYLLDRDTDRCDDTIAQAESFGVRGWAGRVDVTIPDDVKNRIAEAAETMGQITCLVNCAGIFESFPLLDYPLENWNRLMNINVNGTLLCSQEALRRMVPNKRGKVINMASIAGKTGGKNRSAYYASKHAVIGLTRCMAHEMAEFGITVNAICPGMVDTELFDDLLVDTGRHLGDADPEHVRQIMLKSVPLGQMIQPEAVASLAVYLASRDADMMTGQALTLSGGLIMS